MLSQCRNCGGPLDVRQAAGAIKCRYCGVLNQPQQLPVIAPQTPAGWRPPPTWTPPPQFPAPSNVALRYHRPASAVGVIIGVLVPMIATMGIGAAVFIANIGGRSGSRSSVPRVSVGGFPSSSLSALTMAESEATIRARFPGYTTFSDRTVLKLSDGPFNDVMFKWDPEDPNHVAEISFAGSEQTLPAVCAKLKQMLPVHWNGESYGFAGARINCGSSNIYVQGDRKITFSPNQHWRSQTKALWKAVLHAAYGTAKPTTAESRMWLGLGYPLTEIGKIDWNADVDRATPAVQAVFPGAAPSKHIGLNYEIGLDHPWFREAELEWPNEKGGRFKSVDFRPRNGNKFEQQLAIAGCIERAFAVKPRIYDADHLAQKRDYDFNLKGGGEVRVYEHMVAVWLDRRPMMTRDTWLKLLATLDACGRGK